MKSFADTEGLSTGDRPTLDSPAKLHDIPAMHEILSGMRPVRWLAFLPLVILPFLAALVLQAPFATALLGREVQKRLAESGQGWADVVVTGRDVQIRGVAPDRAAADAAYRTVAETFGVRRAELRVRVGN